MTMSVTSWSDALTGQLCGLYDNNVRNDFFAVQEAMGAGISSSARLGVPATRRASAFKVCNTSQNTA